VPQAPIPSPTCTLLCTEEYPGYYEFEVNVNGENSGKNWLYSYVLNKLFININAVIHLSFKCNAFPSGFYIRAVAVFSNSDDFKYPVERCLHHRTPENAPDGQPDNHIDHVVLVDHPWALYECDETSQRRSVRMLLDSPQAGTDWVNIPFKFKCKNSCISGMNRRPTEIIFTLEDSTAVVYGRQKMKIRICSCPKRDKQKEEANNDVKNDVKNIPKGKRLMTPENNEESPATKQRKTDEMLQIPVANLKVYLKGIDFMYNYMLKTLKKENRNPTEKERQCIKEYREKLISHKKFYYA
ncbi:hypothetical protein L9F63_011322, partial [Diploptera punctata]